jgi:hypothetical protein
VVTALGAIEGTVGFPGPDVPRLYLYAVRVDKPATLAQNVGPSSRLIHYMFENMQPGTYHLLAYRVDRPDQVGGYTQMVLCGLKYGCNDHSLIDVIVHSGELVHNIYIGDWYAPPGALPPKPS